VQADQVEALDRDRPASAQVLGGKGKPRRGCGSGSGESEDGCG
jgi:hypothetical protein